MLYERVGSATLETIICFHSVLKDFMNALMVKMNKADDILDSLNANLANRDGEVHVHGKEDQDGKNSVYVDKVVFTDWDVSKKRLICAT